MRKVLVAIALMLLALPAMASDWINCLSVEPDGTQSGDIENGEVTATLEGDVVTFTFPDGSVESYPMARVAVTACDNGQVFFEEVTQDEIDGTTTITAAESTDTTTSVEILTPLVLVAEPTAVIRQVNILRF